MANPPAASLPPSSQDTSSAPVAYVNYFQARGNRDEIFLDFGVRAPAQSEQSAEAAHVTHRLALNYKTVRDLSAFLNWLVQQQTQLPAAAPPARDANGVPQAAADSPPA